MAKKRLPPAISPERRLRRARTLRDRLLSRTDAAAPSVRDIDTLVRLALLLATQVPPEEADEILDTLSPHAAHMNDEHASALAEALMLRNRPDVADSIWRRLPEIPRMQSQLRCLAHRLVHANEIHGDDPDTLRMVIEIVLEEPLTILASLTASKRIDRDTALVVYSAVRLLHRSLERAATAAPALAGVVASLCDPHVPPTSHAVQAADAIAADAERFSIGPGDVPTHMAGDPILERVDEMIASRLSPPIGAPTDPVAYCNMLREACYGSTI